MRRISSYKEKFCLIAKMSFLLNIFVGLIKIFFSVYIVYSAKCYIFFNVDFSLLLLNNIEDIRSIFSKA